tara:strand:+ start:1222 stop:1674 length:453 start_codon:yes stop_codon:yes gene_type:complete
MKIINFYNDLQEREKKLLFISFVLIISLVLYFIFSGVYSNYTRSSLNLEKAKSDYEYVLNKIQRIQNSYDKNVLDKNVITKLISSNNFENKVNNLQISSTDKLIYVTFTSSNINDAVSVTEKLMNGSLNQISNIRYQQSDKQINTQLIFN